MRLGVETLAGVVAPGVLLDAVQASRRLAGLGVPHALIGGLAVGLHGYPRATRDVDFLVGDQAFAGQTPLVVFRREIADLARIGIIDLMGVPPGHGELVQFLSIPKSGEIPVLPVAALVMLKLLAGGPQDLADVHALLQAGAEAGAIKDFLVKYAPELVPALARQSE